MILFKILPARTLYRLKLFIFFKCNKKQKLSNGFDLQKIFLRNLKAFSTFFSPIEFALKVI